MRSKAARLGLVALLAMLAGCAVGEKRQLDAALAGMPARGELASLDERMFDRDVAQQGLWRPRDFLLEQHAGIWLLEPYDPGRVPVLFVHGINGTPADFRYLVSKLDRNRFQAWVYYYPSGLHLDVVADHLERCVTEVEKQYGVHRFAVVAHSMGGLVSRGFVQRHYANAHRSEIPLFVSISTPWHGDAAAASAPVSLDVWRDLVPGSDYQRTVLGNALPQGIEHHLVFTFHRREAWFGQSGDQAVSVSSQLAPAAQKDAVRIYGFDATHMGVLQDPALSGLLNELLARRFDLERSAGAD